MVTEIGSKPERRAAILQAAREILGRKGLEAAKISDIVARAGVAQGTFYLYFPSKWSLVMALTEEMNAQVLARVQEVVARAETYAAAITGGITATFEAMGRYQDVLDIIHSRIGLPEMRAACEEMYQPFYAFISEIIRQGQSQGVLASEVNPEIAARLIVGLVEHAANQCYVYQVQPPSEAYIAEVARFVRAALGATA